MDPKNSTGVSARRRRWFRYLGWRKATILHPVLFAAQPVLFLYAQNVDFTPLNEALVPLLISTGCAVLLFSLLSFILKDAERAGLLVSLFLLFFFSYGHFCDALEGLTFTVWRFTTGPDGLLMAAWGVLLTLGVHRVLRTRGNLRPLTIFLNVAAALLVVGSVAKIVLHEMRRSAWADGRRAERVEVIAADLDRVGRLPDIYYIILDAYASVDALEEVSNFDNWEFIDHLTEMGFFISPDARSNYTSSSLSLASSLNMEYINYLSDVLGVKSRDRKIPNQMIEDSRVVRFLKSKGYRFVHFRSGWGPTNSNGYADWDIGCGRWNEFMMVMANRRNIAPDIDLARIGHRSSQSYRLKRRIVSSQQWERSYFLDFKPALRLT